MPIEMELWGGSGNTVVKILRDDIPNDGKHSLIYEYFDEILMLHNIDNFIARIEIYYSYQPSEFIVVICDNLRCTDISDRRMFSNIRVD